MRISTGIITVESALGTQMQSLGTQMESNESLGTQMETEKQQTETTNEPLVPKTARRMYAFTGKGRKELLAKKQTSM